MAQGTIKSKTPKPKPATKASTAGVLKRGSRQINPKKTSLIRQAQINKKFTAGLTAQTERMLGQKAGHLEMLGGKKKDKSGEKAKAKATHGKKNAAKK